MIAIRKVNSDRIQVCYFRNWLIGNLNSFGLKYRNLKFISFDFCKRILFENFEDRENCNFYVVNSVLMFFTNLDSGFIDDQVIEFLVDFYVCNLDEKEFNKYISLTGIISCLLKIMHLTIHKKNAFNKKKYFVKFSFDRLLPYLAAVEKNYYFYFKSNYLESAYSNSLIDDRTLLYML